MAGLGAVSYQGAMVDYAMLPLATEVLAEAARHYGLTFHHVPVTAETKPAAEAKHLELLRAAGVEFVVLARYMQVLSEDFLKKFGQPVINIHHSFLPAFAGGRVTHRHSVDDLVRKGRDLEKSVLAQAVRWHLENRILVYGNKTVVFD